MVTISDNEIGSPYIDKPDSLIIMNEPSLEKFKHRIKNKGLLIINSSLIAEAKHKNAHICKHPFTEIAINLGNIKVANMVALGSFIAKKNVVALKTVFEAITGFAPPEKKYLIEINKKALEEGAGLK
jgi:2-oxoglutarate ferredoxin oxidoreductase subunit gamma